MTFGAFMTLEGKRFQMLIIRIEKKHFLTLKFACCTNSFRLCPLVEKLLFERKLVTLLSYILLMILRVFVISPLM